MTFTKIKSPSRNFPSRWHRSVSVWGIGEHDWGYLKACTYRAPGTFHCFLPPSRADTQCPPSSVTQPIACVSENLPFSRHSAFKSVTEGCWGFISSQIPDVFSQNVPSLFLSNALFCRRISPGEEIHQLYQLFCRFLGLWVNEI